MQRIRQTLIPRRRPGVVLFLMLLLAVSLTGCRRAVAPPRDRLRTQQIQDAFAAMAKGESANSIRRLKRLHDLMPEEPFYTLALAWEQQRRVLEEVNALLAHGRFVTAAAFLREEMETGGHAFGALAEAEAVCSALQALHAVAARRPFPSSSVGATALQDLTPHMAVLERCEDFTDWLTQQQAAVAELRREERAALYRHVLDALDRAVVQGEDSVGELCSQVRAQGEEQPSALLLAAGFASRWDTLTAALDRPPACNEAGRMVEIVACLFWRELPSLHRQQMWRWCATRAPRSLSGVLLRALLAAERGDVTAVRTWLGRLSETSRIHPELLGTIIEQVILPQEQFGASCWRSAFPSVPDVLRQLAQIRAQLDEDRR